MSFTEGLKGKTYSRAWNKQLITLWHFSIRREYINVFNFPIRWHRCPHERVFHNQGRNPLNVAPFFHYKQIQLGKTLFFFATSELPFSMWGWSAVIPSASDTCHSPISRWIQCSLIRALILWVGPCRYNMKLKVSYLLAIGKLFMTGNSFTSYPSYINGFFAVGNSRVYFRRVWSWINFRFKSKPLTLCFY